MFSSIAKLALTATALAPVLFTYAWAVWGENARLALSLALLGVALAFLCLLMLRLARRLLEEVPVTIDSAEASDRENIAFLLLYISPLFSDGLSELNWSLWLPIIVIFGLTVATGYNYHFSPLLGMFGWHAYKVSSQDGVTYVLLTKARLRSTLGVRRVRQLTEYVLIEF
jgi:hypothetical protein